MPGWPSLSFSLTTLVLGVCLAINIALVRQDYSFAKNVRSASGSQYFISRIRYPTPIPTLYAPKLHWRDLKLIDLPDLARRLPYPDELPIAAEPVVLETVRDSHYGMDADSDWTSLFPEGFSLEPITNASLLSQEVISKVPSMYNQLYCLNRLRKIFMNPGWEEDKCKDRQVHRCLNLLRQGLLCNGDTALEPTITVEHEGAKETGASGYDVKHICRDWTKVRAATEQRLGSHH